MIVAMGRLTRFEFCILCWYHRANAEQPAADAEQPAAASEGAADSSATETTAQEDSESQKAADKPAEVKVLMGVIRVGQFAKLIMLDGDLLAELVVICADKPTTTLLRRLATLMATEILVTLLMFVNYYCQSYFLYTNIFQLM